MIRNRNLPLAAMLALDSFFQRDWLIEKIKAYNLHKASRRRQHSEVEVEE